jgi:hypothetical protein
VNGVFIDISGASDLNVGHIVTVSVSINHTVFVAGSPLLILNDGQVATYSSGSGTGILNFSYAVQPGDNTPDLKVTGIDLNGGTIQDAAGTALFDLVKGDLALQIDTIAPIPSMSR